MSVEEQVKGSKLKKHRQREHERYIREKAIADALFDEADRQMLESARKLLFQVYERHSDVELRYVRDRLRRIETIINKLDFFFEGGLTMRPNRLHCPIRTENGNCTCVGGFCAAVPDPVCEAVRNAYDSGWTDCALKVRKEQRLKASPTIEAEPVRHGRWEFKHPNGWACSECGEWGLMIDNRGICKSNYCPNCGAKMDGDSHE